MFNLSKSFNLILFKKNTKKIKNIKIKKYNIKKNIFINKSKYKIFLSEKKNIYVNNYNLDYRNAGMGFLKFQRRSKWKGVYCNFLYKKFNRSRTRMIFSNRAENDMLNRRSTVLPKHIGYVIKIYNGKRYFRRLMKFEMIGFKFGDFTLNSKGGSNIHKTEKNKNKFK